jgi:ubiquinol-cytochrome c reductase cytochrome c1 subunit
MPFALRITLAAVTVLGLTGSVCAQEIDTHAREPKHVEFEFEGPFGTYDRAALQRGFQVYKEVCAACHSLKRIAFRNLHDEGGPGFSEASARALAAAAQIPAEPNDEGLTHNDSGERLTRPGLLADYFPEPFPNENAARTANGGSLPPDLSLMVKARHHGAAYIYSLLTGYGEKPPAGFAIAKDKHFNPYFAGFNIGMPAPITNNGVTFSDGTAATIDQQAKDVVTFLAWAAEPKMEQRKRMGFSVLIFLAAFAAVLFLAYRKVWADKH